MQQQKFIDDMVPIVPISGRDTVKENASWLRQFLLAKKNNPGARRICHKCFTAIYDEGKCPTGCEGD